MIKHFILVLLITSLITSCGFHLRGSFDIPSNLQTIQLQSSTDPYWTRAIKYNLANAGVTIKNSAFVILKLHNAEDTRRVASYNENAKAAEFQLRSALEFSVEDKNGVLLIPKRLLVSERIYRNNESQIAGKSREETQLKREMQQDLIRQLIQQFRLAVVTTHTKTE